MMNSKDVEQMLKKLKPEFEKNFGVKEIGFFGSFARGEASEKSDIDILVEFKKPIGWDFFDLKEILERTSGHPIDLVTKKALKPGIREKILKETIFT